MIRYTGALLGLAIGDALGTTVEFSSPGTFEPVRNIVGGGPFGLRPGQWTDDTSMALCLAESLIERREFDPIDQLQRYVRWWKEGHLSSTGHCFDIGNTTRTALQRFVETGRADAGPTSPDTAGNGSLMRLAPIPLAYASIPSLAIGRSGASSRTTHGAPAAVDACRYYGGLIVGALQGHSKEVLLSPRFRPAEDGSAGRWPAAGEAGDALVPEVDEVASGSFARHEPPRIVGSGYVVRSMEAALWAFARGDSFEEGVLLAVNLGNDADTTGAIYGQLAGAYYGAEALPPRWVEVVAMRAEIERTARALLELRHDHAPSSDGAAG